MNTTGTALSRQPDVLALAAGLAHFDYDEDVFDEPAVLELLDELEDADPVAVALAGAGLVFELVRELAEARGELVEDVLQRIAPAIVARAPRPA